ncbi:MAG: nucleotidyltransferase family protein [Spirochaetaceae bacterium]|nr:nucleotidyltransferase family protein [Spirochaetaceae bacterium]MBQ3024528.1 nucleotidyltransferase family protein [Spirochaetaceae bacterium]
MNKFEIKTVLLGVLNKRTEEENKIFEKIIQSNIDWSYITGELIRHRLNGYFLNCLTNEQKKLIFKKIILSFDLLCNIYEVCNKKMLSFAEKIFAEANKENIKIAGLKGLVFNTSIYNLKTRKSNDLDILIHEKDLLKFDKIMKRMGFIQSFDGGISEATKKEKLIQRLNYHDLVPYCKRINSPYLSHIEIDVNFHFDNKNHDITKEILNDGLHIYEKNGYSIQGLKWQNHLLFLCVHFYREASNTIWRKGARDVDLYKLVDIENMFRSYTENQLYEWIDSVRKFNLEKQCYFTLFYINKFYPKKLYKNLMKKIKLKNNSYIYQIYVNGENKIIKRKKNFFDEAFDMHYEKK